MRSYIGFGFDVHRLVSGRALILGGVNIPFELGLAGHSDADVLLHAVSDALLGAAGLGDIGMHFPDSDPALNNISSIAILGKTKDKLIEKKFVINNIDCTLAAEAPRISCHRPAMRKNIALALGTDPGRVNIKATTTEGLGFAGRGEGIAAFAAASLVKGEGRNV